MPPDSSHSMGTPIDAGGNGLDGVTAFYTDVPVVQLEALARQLTPR
jgi:hypothetical protein